MRRTARLSLARMICPGSSLGGVAVGLATVTRSIAPRGWGARWPKVKSWITMLRLGAAGCCPACKPACKTYNQAGVPGLRCRLCCAGGCTLVPPTPTPKPAPSSTNTHLGRCLGSAWLCSRSAPCRRWPCLKCLSTPCFPCRRLKSWRSHSMATRGPIPWQRPPRQAAAGSHERSRGSGDVASCGPDVGRPAGGQWSGQHGTLLPPSLCVWQLLSWLLGQHLHVPSVGVQPPQGSPCVMYSVRQLLARHKVQRQQGLGPATAHAGIPTNACSCDHN